MKNATTRNGVTIPTALTIAANFLRKNPESDEAGMVRIVTTSRNQPTSKIGRALLALGLIELRPVHGPVMRQELRKQSDHQVMRAELALGNGRWQRALAILRTAKYYEEQQGVWGYYITERGLRVADGKDVPLLRRFHAKITRTSWVYL